MHPHFPRLTEKMSHARGESSPEHSVAKAEAFLPPPPAGFEWGPTF